MSAALAPLAEAFGTVRGWLEGRDGAPPATEADRVAQAFDLDPFARNVLLLSAYAALEPEARAQLALLPGATSAAPPVSVALARLPEAHWQALAPGGPLRRNGLVRLEGAGAMTEQRIALAEPVLFRLLGAPSLGALSAQFLWKVAPRPGLTPNRAALSENIAARLTMAGSPILHLNGPDPEGKLQALAHAAGTVYALSATTLPPAAGELMKLATELERDMILVGGRLALVLDPGSDDASARLFAGVYGGPLSLIATEPLQIGHRLALRLEMQPMTAEEQAPVWEAALRDLGTRLNGAVPRMAATFRVPPETADAIAAELSAIGAESSESGLAEAAWDACRRAARPKMDDLAQRIGAHAVWDDLVLPERQKATLAAIAAQVRNRAQVYEAWGFGARLQHKGLGVSAMFSGPSGAGKSMAGEVLGAALDLDVYRVDLSALVSKWVGETEKNLRRVFDAAEDGGVILQFDEADALFGKRSEVKDSRDRTSNIEVSYLLQRLEAYRGLCILTTNLRDNIDEAFLRRIRFIVDFRFPTHAERLAIWQRIFPRHVPLAGVDHTRLAQLNVPGGSIRNIALGAAFLAAERDGSVTMAELYAAARQEYEKLGRSMTDAERAGWV